MLDRPALKLLSPWFDRVAARLARWGVGADAVTVIGFGLGLLAAVAIASGATLTGLAFILLSRLADGLDGPVARQTHPTDRGAFLDIALDFAFYASVPLAFAWANPAANALPAAVLLAAFIGTGSSFLAFAAIAERRGLRSMAYPSKGLYYLGGLTEATETLLCFAAMCLWPDRFAALACGFALLCGLTWLARVRAGWTLLRDAP
jgi:phosphatidylglycerophosphate synthase